MKSSQVEDRKVESEYAVGVTMGSIENVERRTSGVDVDIRVGIVEWRSVVGRRLGEMEKEGRSESDGYIVRGGAEVGVTMRRVRIRSRGARTVAAIAVAAIATARDMNGDGLSIMSRPPIPLAVVLMRPGSGTLRSAESRPRVQLSVVLSRKLYMKVTFVPFQTPHADSFCHSCAITSSKASGLLSSSFRGASGGACVGVESLDRLGPCLLLLSGLRDDSPPGEKGCSCLLGAVLVKYPGESSSDSSSEG